VAVGGFTDSNTAATAGQFTASITWGDGTSSAGTVVPGTGSVGAFTVNGLHTYAAPRDYTIQIVVQDQAGDTTKIISRAIVSPAAVTLTPIPATVGLTTGFLPNPLVVGSFYDSNTAATAGQLTASINWGDGNTTPGVVTASPGAAGLFLVSGSHLYVVPKTYTIMIAVEDQTGNSTTIMSTAVVTTASVGGNAPALTGGLANIVANGPHAAQGFTNTNRPTFSGTAAPFTVVQLYARHFNADAQLYLGETVANANGQWSFTSGPLAVGTYIVSATATIPGGYPSGLIPLQDNTAKQAQLVYVGLTPRIVRRLSRGERWGHHGPGPHLSYPGPPLGRRGH
jgi:hypothetical protein